VAVEVGGAGAGRDGAGAGETGEERLDVGVCAHVAIAVKVGRAASACDSHEVGGGVKGEPTHVLAPGVAAEAPGGNVEARGGGTARGECASREVDPAHVLSPGKAQEVHVGGVDVHAEVGARVVGVGRAVRGGTIAQVDPPDVLAPDETGQERGVKLSA